MQIQAEALTGSAFAPFGEIIQRPSQDPTAVGPGWQWWGETVSLPGDGRPFGIGFLQLQPVAPRFDWAERHMRSHELLVPIGGDCLVYVGPPDYPDQPDRLPALEQFRVFRVQEGQSVLLHPGVWHGAPLAVDAPMNVVVLLLEQTGNIDTSVVRFEATPVEIDVQGA
jgi:ureidoglycolate lyase